MMPQPYGKPRKPHFWQAILKLMGHVFGGAVLFYFIAGLTWLLGYGIKQLHLIEPFGHATLSLIHNVELALLYVDYGLSGVVVLVGGYRFIKEII